VGALLLGYLLLVVLMMWFERFLVYPTWQIPPGDWQPAGLRFEEVWFESQDGTKLCGWYFEHAQARAQVVYYHGNGENLAHMGEYMASLRDEFQVSILAFDYRGYGKSEGKPHEAGILADGHAAQQWLAQRAGVPVDRLVLWGRSIGGAVAVDGAATHGARGLILERTFTSLPDVAAIHYPFLPVRRLMRNRYDSLARIPRYDGPLLQSHGTADEVIPLVWGQRLFEAAPSEDKQFVAMEQVTHNGPNTREYYTELDRFLERIP
jgi:hypothetical protein